MRLKNKKALITGGSEGIGFACAKRFLNEGAEVFITGRSEEKLKKAKQELKAVHTCAADVSDLKAIDRAYKQFHEVCGKCDILIANAGVSLESPFGSTSEADFDRLFAINVKGVFFTVQKALPYLNDGASIVLIASLAAQQGLKNYSLYAATKAAVISLSQSFSAELLSRKIRVNSISPGVTRTTILEKAGLSKEAQDKWTAMIPMKRLADPSEIATVALFLASDDSSYMTATDLVVDGGIAGISPL
jgi:NAD(P)-dependent dehydrogenase (short-subunit alcohol dehydrogenase family)